MRTVFGSILGNIARSLNITWTLARLVPWMRAILLDRSKTVFIIFIAKKVKGKKKGRHFAVASLCQDTALHYNDCVAFKKSVNILEKRCKIWFSRLLFAYVYSQSCLFIDDRLYQKILTRRSRTSKLMTMKVSCVNFFIMASGQ